MTPVSIQPVCLGCLKFPNQLGCYLSCAEDAGLTPDEYVRQEEGTYNPENGHFLCDSCYIAAGMPTGRYGWTCP
jgi:hypothetical protein